MLNFLRKNELTLWLFIIFVCLVAILIYILFNQSKDDAIMAEKINLQTLADEKAAQANLFIDTQKEKLAIISSLDVFKEAAMYPNDAEKIAAAKKTINDLKDAIPGIGLLTKEGIVIVSENDPAGTDYSSLPVFPATNESTVTFTRYYDYFDKRDNYNVGGLVYDKIDKNKAVGVIAFNVILDDLSKVMQETVEGLDNEVYLIDETGLLLSASEFIGQDNIHGVLVQQVKSEGAKVCLDDINKYQKKIVVEDHDEEVLKYLNYMGNEVYGAHAYVPQIRGCILAEESSAIVDQYSLFGYIKNILIGIR